MALEVPTIKEFFNAPQSSQGNLKKDSIVDLFDLNVHHEKNIEKIIQNVNNCLNSAINRKFGLNLLSVLIPHCPTNVLTEHCVQWLKLCVPTQVNKPVPIEQLYTLESLLKNCSNIQDFTKCLTSGLLPKLIELLLTNISSNKFLDNSLNCLQLCLQKYSSTCLPLKNKISGVLLKLLESQLPDSLIQKAGVCYHYLQQVGGAGPEGINHINNWLKEFQKLCGTAQNLYDILLENVTEYNTIIRTKEHITFSDIPSTSSPTDLLIITSNRLKNTLLFINSFLISSYTVAKNVPVTEILDLIKRGISADCYKKVQNTEDVYLSFLLYNNQIQVLVLLKSLLACLKTNILPQSLLITKLLTDCIKRCQTYKYFHNKSELQVTTYQVFSYWIFIAKNAINHSLNDKFVDSLITDIQPMKNYVTLNLSREFAKKSTKLRQETEKLDVVSNTARIITENVKDVTERKCLEALKVLKDLFTFTSLSLKAATLTKIHNLVITTLTEIQGGKIETPYHNVNCQVALYDLALSFFEQKSSGVLPPLYSALHLFQNGRSSKNHLVARACSTAERILESFCQPVCPTLYLGSVVQNDVSEEDVIEVIDQSNDLQSLENDKESNNLQLIENDDQNLNESEISSKVHVEENILSQKAASNTDKIKILSVDIIKCADVSVENSSPNEDENEDDVILDISEVSESNAEVKSMSSEYDSDLELRINESDDDDIQETPPLKKMKMDEELQVQVEKDEVIDDKEEEMLKSFVDDVIED